MAALKIECYGVIVLFYLVGYYLFYTLSKGFFCILQFVETTYYQTFQLIQLARSFQVQHQAVYVIQVLAYVFYKKNFAIALQLRYRACKVCEYRKIATGKHGFCHTISIER